MSRWPLFGAFLNTVDASFALDENTGRRKSIKNIREMLRREIREELDFVDWLPADLEILPKIVRFNRMAAGLV